MSEYRYTVLFEPAEGRRLRGHLPGPAWPAREMVRDAIRGYVESLAKDGLPAPQDIKLMEEPVKEEVAVALR